MRLTVRRFTRRPAPTSRSERVACGRGGPGADGGGRSGASACWAALSTDPSQRARAAGSLSRGSGELLAKAAPRAYISPARPPTPDERRGTPISTAPLLFLRPSAIPHLPSMLIKSGARIPRGTQPRGAPSASVRATCRGPACAARLHSSARGSPPEDLRLPLPVLPSPPSLAPTQRRSCRPNGFGALLRPRKTPRPSHGSATASRSAIRVAGRQQQPRVSPPISHAYHALNNGFQPGRRRRRRRPGDRFFYGARCAPSD